MTLKGMKIKLLERGKFSKRRGEILIFGKQLANGYLKKTDNKNKFMYTKKERFMQPLYLLMKSFYSIRIFWTTSSLEKIITIKKIN